MLLPGFSASRAPPSKQNLQSSRQNSRPSKQIDRSFLSLGSKPFRLKLSRCCFYYLSKKEAADWLLKGEIEKNTGAAILHTATGGSLTISTSTRNAFSG